MPVQITIPSPGESITEVVLGAWHRESGAWVEKDDPLVEIESDKVTLEVSAPESGVLAIGESSGAELRVGAVIGTIDPDAARPAAAAKGDGAKAQAGAKQASASSAAAAPAGRVEVATETAAAATSASGGTTGAPALARSSGATPRATPLARKVAEDRGVDLARLHGTGPSGRIRKSDVLSANLPGAPAGTPAPTGTRDLAVPGERSVRREKMSKLRLRIAERLVEAQHSAAMLTTFNECDMSEVMRLRREHRESFQERHGVNLGFMSFFVKACVSALEAHPGVNAYIIGEEIEYHDYVDISVAVGTPRGLVVPVVRSAESLSFAGIESAIQELAARARDGKLTLDEMTGGTFTISNGGVYGSLMSTPILNPPQSGILGMHKIMSRAVEDPDKPGTLVLRPMMYLALSYDHRVVDGEQAVRFLVHVKERIESPERMLLEV